MVRVRRGEWRNARWGRGGGDGRLSIPNALVLINTLRCPKREIDRYYRASSKTVAPGDVLLPLDFGEMVKSTYSIAVDAMRPGFSPCPAG